MPLFRYSYLVYGVQIQKQEIMRIQKLAGNPFGFRKEIIDSQENMNTDDFELFEDCFGGENGSGPSFKEFEYKGIKFFIGIIPHDHFDSDIGFENPYFFGVADTKNNLNYVVGKLEKLFMNTFDHEKIKEVMKEFTNSEPELYILGEDCECCEY